MAFSNSGITIALIVSGVALFLYAFPAMQIAWVWWRDIKATGQKLQFSLVEISAVPVMLTPTLSIVGQMDSAPGIIVTSSLVLFSVCGVILGSLLVRIRRRGAAPAPVYGALAIFLGASLALVPAFVGLMAAVALVRREEGWRQILSVLAIGAALQMVVFIPLLMRAAEMYR